MSDPELGGFDFLSAEKPKTIGVSEAAKLLTRAQRPAEPRMFETTPEGLVKASGYTPDEVKQLLKNYRDHIVAFTKAMQEFQTGMDVADNPLYRPGGYQ